jgi:hypothetical protein
MNGRGHRDINSVLVVNYAKLSDVREAYAFGLRLRENTEVGRAANPCQKLTKKTSAFAGFAVRSSLVASEGRRFPKPLVPVQVRAGAPFLGLFQEQNRYPHAPSLIQKNDQERSILPKAGPNSLGRQAMP